MATDSTLPAVSESVSQGIPAAQTLVRLAGISLAVGLGWGADCALKLADIRGGVRIGAKDRRLRSQSANLSGRGRHHGIRNEVYERYMYRIEYFQFRPFLFVLNK